jgi:glycosyltransferase involved in cell wall biosynthesis
MRIALLTQYYPPEMGAPQGRLSELAVRFAQAGHDVFVLTAMPSYPHGRVFEGYGGVFRKEHHDGVTVVRTWAFPNASMNVRRRLANYGSFMLSSALVGTFSLPRVDFLITETPPLFLGLSGWLLARSRGASWIMNVSDLWVESAARLGVLHEGAALTAARRLEAFLAHRADVVSGQSRGIVGAIRETYSPVRTYHLSNGVDTERFRPEMRSETARAELGGPAGCVGIYAGLLGIAQGLEQLLRAAAMLTDLPEFRLVIVGDGPDAPRLQQLANDLRLTNVAFLGARPREEIPALLASADIGVIPLGTDLPGAVPSKLYETMASGLPALLVAGGEPAEIVANAEAGVAVSPGDIESLTSAIRALVSDKARRHDLGLGGRKAAVDNFNRDQIVEQFMVFLDSELAVRHA